MELRRNGWIESGSGTQRGGVALDALRNVGESVVAADPAQSAEVRFGEALVLADQGGGKVDVLDLAGRDDLGQRQGRFAALGVKDTMARVDEVRTFFDWSEAKTPMAVSS